MPTGLPYDSVGLSKTLRSSVFARRQPIRARGAWTDFVSTSLGRALPWGGIGSLYPVSILSSLLSIRIAIVVVFIVIVVAVRRCGNGYTGRLDDMRIGNGGQQFAGVCVVDIQGIGEVFGDVQLGLAGMQRDLIDSVESECDRNRDR